MSTSSWSSRLPVHPGPARAGRWAITSLCLALLGAGCETPEEAGAPADQEVAADGAAGDAGRPDGASRPDADTPDADAPDADVLGDARVADAEVDAASPPADGGLPDAESPDAMSPDAEPADAEAPACLPGAVEICPGAAACTGTRRCGEDGVFGPCTFPEERCNDLDDDCDGQVDEAFPDLGEPCTVGLGICAAAGRRACGGDLVTACDASPGAPGQEICGNGLDDDCDGSLDCGDADCAASPDCTCGNGALDAGETCDDGARRAGDGCAADCRGEADFVCADPAVGACPAGAVADTARLTLGEVRGPAGSAGGEAFEDACPEGQVVTGFDFGIGLVPDLSFEAEILTRARAHCSVLTVGATGQLAPGSPTPDRGGLGAPAYSLTCPANQAVTGLLTWSVAGGGGRLTTGVQLLCAPLTVVNGALAVGAATATERVGSERTFDGRFECPAGQVAGAHEGQAGGALDRLGVRCGAFTPACRTPSVCVYDPPCVPAEETCNAQDDDCDGVTDEVAGLGADCTVGLGVCLASGRQVCDLAAAALVCDAVAGAPAEEICDGGLDEDCDGLVDCEDPACAQDAGCRCGDGRLDLGEACDDGNDASGDGCDAGCVEEADFYCREVPAEICAEGQGPEVAAPVAGERLAAVGGPGGEAFEERCGPTEVLIGLDVGYGAWQGNPSRPGFLRRVRPRCGQIRLTEDGIEVAPSSEGEGDGGDFDLNESMLCPAAQVVVGYQAWYGLNRSLSPVHLAGLQLRCAPVSRAADGSVALGASALTAAAGDLSDFAGAFECPAGTVAGAHAGRAGEVVDQYTLRCDALDAACLAPSLCTPYRTCAYDFEAGSLPAAFGAGGDAPWTVAPDAGEGGGGLRSGAIADRQQSQVSLEDLVFGVGGRVSFRYRVSSEGGYDFLQFDVDGVNRLSVSGQDGGWQTLTLDLTEAAHTLLWRYTKDDSRGEGDDRGQIDDLVLQGIEGECP